MDEAGKSDNRVVPQKVSNKARRRAAEGLEGRRLAEWNSPQAATLRTQGRGGGETGAPYGQEREAHLAELSDRVRRGAYRPQPVRRAYVPKRDGQQRPIGVTALEDKIVQRATVAVLNAVYEPEFAGFSYGARPGRSAHHALAALDRGLMSKPIEWVLDADLRNFFGSLDQAKLVAFVERRIGDERVVRLIRRWLAAGVLEDGKWTRSGTGTEQGGSISPLLANVYLHYVFDVWTQRR